MPTFEHCGRVERNVVHGECRQFLCHWLVSRQEAAAHAVCHCSQAEIKARWLQLAGFQGLHRGSDPTLLRCTTEPLKGEYSWPQAHACLIAHLGSRVYPKGIVPLPSVLPMG